MPLFQRPPSTPEELEKNRPLDLAPDAVAELDERGWYERAYRGDDAPQLTPRAVGMGAALGFFLAVTNVYIGLKAGMHLGVALTACILSFAIWNRAQRAGFVRAQMTILESNCMQSTASAAGFSTGNTLIGAIPALLLLSVTPSQPGGTPIPVLVAGAWVFFLGVLGCCLAIPMKRNLINREKLRFPDGTAAAVLLRSLHTEGREALAKARALLYAALAGGVVPLVKDLELFTRIEKGNVVRQALLPGALKIFDWLPGISGGGKVFPLSAWLVKLDYGPALIAVGALVGVRVTASMLASALGLVLFLGPAAMGATWTNALGKVVPAAAGPGSAWKDIGIWMGAPILVSSGLLAFAFEWRTLLRTFSGLVGGGGRAPGEEGVEVPGSWFAGGSLLAAAAIVALAWRYFGIPVHYGVLAVLMCVVLAMVACRATGETNVTPTGALGKIIQLAYGGLMPQNAAANLMTAGITAGASVASADLLTDLKSGYLLGANPRRQFVAQILGVLPGTVAGVLCYTILVPDASALTGEGGKDPAFPAPSAQTWLAVAKVFQLGLGNLHPMARHAIFWGVAVGVVLTLLERALPKEKRKYLPSPTGVGLGLVLAFSLSLSMFLGAAVAAIASRKEGSRSAEMVIPVASGLIVGESIAGVVVAAINIALR